jgi:hypothetical protein
MPFWRRRGKEGPHETYVGLRSQLLGLDPRTLGLEPPPQGARVWACLMDMGFSEGVATLVVVADGTTSMYTSTGGGVIGGGEHESVARESRAFLEVVERHLGHLAAAPDPDLPPDGFVHIHALTHEGRLVATAPESQLADGGHELSPVYVAGHRVLTALREAETGRAES